MINRPAQLASQAQAYTRSVTGAERAAWAIALAGSYDAALKKEAAFEWIGKALDNLPGAAQPAQLRRVREMVRNRIAVYHAVTEKWVRALEKGHPGSPLVAAMRTELEGYKRRAAAKNARYLFP